MAISVDFEVKPERLKAFAHNEAELQFTVSTSDQGVYWVECLIEAPSLISLAPHKSLDKGKMLIGIVGKGEKLEKKIKFFANNGIYPDTYGLKFTFLVYDKDAAITERVTHTKKIECVEAANAAVQS